MPRTLAGAAAQMFSPCRLVLLAVVLLTGACAASPQRSPQAEIENVDEAAVTALYAEIDRDARRFEAALDLARSGDNAGAGVELKAALDDLRAAAARCGSLAGCDEQRVFAVFDRLLRLHVDGLADEGAEGDAGGATPEAGSEAGESSPVVAALPELGRSVTLLKGRKLGDVIALNGPVKAALEEWLTQYRPNLTDAYANYEYMRYRMWPEYRKAGLPEAVLFGMLAKESGGKVHAVSRSGAAGPLQFMYATGLRFGLATIDGFDERFDPTLSARANAAYLNEQLAIFNDNLDLVLGAYNGGEGRMQRLVGKTGRVSFWDPKIYFAVSPETREYVPMVLAAAWLFLHPERYNLQFPKIDGRPGSITLEQPASIAELTVCLGQDGNRDGWFRTLRNLNPELDPQQSQPAGTRLAVPESVEAVYAGSCARGHWAALAADLHSAIAPPPPTALAAHRAAPPTYTVRKGDTLTAITRKYDCRSMRHVARTNGIRAPRYAIRVGQTLRLTGCSAR